MPQKCLRKYGQAATIVFTLFETDGVNFKIDASFASGDVTVMKDEGAEANTTNLPTDEGKGYSLVLTATEMEAARVVVYLMDQGTKTWLDDYLVIETYGHANAEHAFDLDSASVTVGTNNDKTGYALTSAYDPAKTAAQAGDAMTLTAAYDAAKTAAQEGDAMTLTAAYDAAKTAAQAGDAMTLTTAYDAAKTAASQSSVNAIPTNPLLTNDARLDNLDATISSRLATAGYTAPDNTGIAAAQAAAEANQAILEELTEDDGGGNLRYTEKALEQAPSGSGVGDWTSEEKEQIRYRLQIDGTQTAPAADAPLQMPVSADAIAQDADAAPVLRDSLSSTTIPHIRASVQLWRGDIPASLDGQSVQSKSDIYDDSIILIADAVLDEALAGHTTAGTVGERLGRIPNAAAGGNGGLPTVDASNYVAGVQGTKNKLDDLQDLSSAGAQAAATAALNIYDGPTKAELDTTQASIEALINALHDLSSADIQAAILSWWQTHSMPELTGAPGAEPSPEVALMALLMQLRNATETEQIDDTNGKRRIRNDAGDVIAEADMTVGQLTFNQGKLATP